MFAAFENSCPQSQASQVNIQPRMSDRCSPLRWQTHKHSCAFPFRARCFRWQHLSQQRKIYLLESVKIVSRSECRDLMFSLSTFAWSDSSYICTLFSQGKQPQLFVKLKGWVKHGKLKHSDNLCSFLWNVPSWTSLSLTHSSPHWNHDVHLLEQVKAFTLFCLFTSGFSWVFSAKVAKASSVTVCRARFFLSKNKSRSRA